MSALLSRPHDTETERHVTLIGGGGRKKVRGDLRPRVERVMAQLSAP